MSGRIIIADKPPKNKGPLDQWGVSRIPAYLKENGQETSEENDWAVAICYWNTNGSWLPGRLNNNDFILVHPGHVDLAKVLPSSLSCPVFTWSRGQRHTGPADLGVILADLSGWRKNRRHNDYFTRGVKLLRKTLVDPATDRSHRHPPERSGEAAKIFNDGREEAGLPERGPPPDPVSVLIHDTIGAIDPFVLDVRNLLDGLWELEEFKTYWQGRAATGVRRLRAWLGKEHQAQGEQNWQNPGPDDEKWPKQTRLDQYQPSDEAKKKKEIGDVLTKAPEILGKADTGNWKAEQGEETSEAKPTKATLDELQAWFNSLKERLEELRGSSTEGDG